ncbi:MAG TPA: pyruvate:ferredoxin (flavodoxin) oxidoreductase [Candidatus Ventrousia excrementavium]|uniref:Pyruvate:ferredoxin oxidoreductase n=1 Tax=Candidatus Ventrousia excrementavium TaxID=2840961 RepID=A0A9D1IV71_9CLOT|nr:pyruvate:ferredoxin (flavodoxin) oxidoreductase [Candidatus Ventrousia excrementavium]
MSEPRELMVVDGNEAAAYVAYAFSEIAAIYPITPSSPMAEKTDEWSANGRKNLFGQTVSLVEMQSEAGAIGAVHGALEAGSLATSFTSSQGLMLMIPVLHRISGTKQPAVLHVAARTVGTHAMSIFGDHSDVMNCRQTGFAMLSTGSVQEVMDLAGVAHLAAIEGRIPFMHFFDGFRTSHEIQKIRAIPYSEFGKMLNWDAVEQFRAAALNPDHPTLRNTVQNPDVYFQFREANNRFYDELPDIVEKYMGKINAFTGEDYHLFNYYGAPDAERVVVAMGSVSGAAREAVEYLNARGEKVGYLQVRLFNPFSTRHFLAALPKTVRSIAVLDRCKEMGTAGEPLYLTVCASFANQPGAPLIIGGRYGLSSKDTTPAQIKAVFDNLAAAQPLPSFTIGIVDDVTHRSLPVGEDLPLDQQGMVSCKFWGLGSDGTVGANKNSIKIIGENTDMYTQAYFEYDTKKSFGITKSHLRFGKHPILSTYLVRQADFIACHNQSFLYKYDIVQELKPGGTVLLNCHWSADEVEQHLPASIKRILAERKARLFIIDANAIAQEIGLGNRISMVLQSAFFKLANIIPQDDAARYMKAAAEKSFRKKGEKIVQLNWTAIDRGAGSVVEVPVPESWRTCPDDAPAAQDDAPDFIKNILRPINAQKGDDLPVSTFVGYEDGTMPMGTTAYEKRGIATQIPVWDPQQCLQCNRCSYVCPHAVLRPYLLDEAEAAAAPAGFAMAQAKGPGAEKYRYSLQISEMDCTGCGSCVSCCPASGKALRMEPVERELTVTDAWRYGLTVTEKPVFDVSTVKGSQFKRPLCEFSGACAGCGETPYAKLLTQLFGDRMYWANATGCSQAWGAAMPSIPYTVNQQGKGPAWSNSLFENNAEFSLGMALSVKQQRRRVRQAVEQLDSLTDALHAPIARWLETFDDIHASADASDALADALAQAELSGEAAVLRDRILQQRDQLAKKTIWMYGGDGWAYDIGYGGLDHVIALGEDVNVFVIDTEVYSNTGGQSSKATPLGAVAQFQASGKKSAKKDLGKMMMSYGNCYVASVAMGADMNQLVKAVTEAEAFPGPSVIVAYTPCISHGIKAGMDKVQQEMKWAVDAGYWTLYRYNPLAEKPFTLDSKAPSLDYEDFLRGESRYSALDITFPENAKELFARAAEQARQRYESYAKMAERQ